MAADRMSKQQNNMRHSHENINGDFIQVNKQIRFKTVKRHSTETSLQIDRSQTV
jgi:hypothetical protein